MTLIKGMMKLLFEKMKIKWLRPFFALFFVISGWLFTPFHVVAGTATLSWNPVTEDTLGHAETHPLYYNIYCDTVPAFIPGSANFLAATLNNHYLHTDTRLDDANRHLFYVIHAVDCWGNQSAVSDTVGETGYVLARVRTLLQSPYDVAGDSMSTALRDAGALPLNSPYTQAPRSVTAVPDGVTDWVLLQLRDPVTATIMAQESFFIKRDGALTEMDGENMQLGLTGCTAGDYQYVVRHRNHVAVMSRDVTSFSEKSAVLYDFTSDSTRYAGKGAALELESGVWALWSGDINQDGQVTDIDYAIWRSDADNGLAGYRATDLNFDGICSTRDYVLWYRSNRLGIHSFVP